MPIITLTTDMGLKDYYVGVLKGAILKELPETNIIDISHEIEPFNMQEAAFAIKNAYQEFPDKTVHLIGVDPDAGEDIDHVAIEENGHFFVGADNGMFALIFDRPPSKVVDLNIRQQSEFLTFPSKDIFVPAACHLARGGTLEVLGKPKKSLRQMILFNPTFENNSIIKGLVTHVDSYNNVITNITKRDFQEFGRGRKFMICFRDDQYNITEIHNTYSDAPEGSMMAIFGATGFLEITVNKGKASKLLGLKFQEPIRVEFYD